MESTQLSVEFRERGGARDWRIEVMIDGVPSGHVDSEGHLYRYFEGAFNEITWSFADRDLERLKARIGESVRLSASC